MKIWYKENNNTNHLGGYMRLKTRKLNQYDLQLEHLKYRTQVIFDKHELRMKGYYGEQLLDEVMNSIQFNGIELSDIRLLNNGVERQFDTLLFFNHQILIVDAKYYTGNIEVTQQAFLLNGKPHEHPFTQANRSTIFLRKYLKQHFKNVPDIDAITVFTNMKSGYAIHDGSCMTLKDLPQFIANNQSQFVTYDPLPIAKWLIEHHRDVSIYDKATDLNCIDIQKGLRCPKCKQINTIQLERNLGICKCCGNVFTKNEVFALLVKDYKHIYLTNTATVKALQQFAGFEDRSHLFEKYIRAHYRPGPKRGTYII